MRRLETILSARGMIDQANNALTTSGKARSLPGFTLFSRGAVLSPYEWCVPRPRQDEADVINAYEAYVDRDLGLVPNPGAAAHEAIGKGSWRRYFGLKRSARRWRMPLVKLIAVGQHCTSEPVEVGRESVVLAVAGQHLEVTRRGAYSNFRGQMLKAKAPAADTGFNELSVPFIRTSHPLASFLSGRVEDDVLWLANVAIQGERFGTIPAIQFRSTAAKSTSNRYKPLAVDVLGASLTCQELLTGPPREDLIQALYASAVPNLMTSRHFKTYFGHPFGRRSVRSVHQSTRLEWAAKIEAIVEDLQAKKY